MDSHKLFLLLAINLMISNHVTNLPYNFLNIWLDNFSIYLTTFPFADLL